MKNISTEKNSIKERNKEITYKGIQILKVLKELNYILISLHRQGSYYAGRDKLYYEYEKETTAFINNSRVCDRLANIRRILTEQVDTAVGDDDMDDIERICQDIPYWRKPGDFREEMWIDEELSGYKILTAGGYGVCVFSCEVLQDFLKRKKVKTKKLLDKFQKNKELYLDMRKEGIWVPFVPMDAADYVIKLEGYNAPFDEEWEKKREYGGFNIEIKDALWISSIGSFENFRAEEYTGEEGTYEAQSGVKYYYDANERCYDMPGQEIVYKGFKGTVPGERVYEGFRYVVPSGKYFLSIKGYARKELPGHPEPGYGFLFALEKVEEFDEFNDPGEDDIYDFNVAGM